MSDPEDGLTEAERSAERQREWKESLRKNLPWEMALVVLCVLCFWVLNPLGNPADPSGNMWVSSWTVVEWHYLYTGALFLGGLAALLFGFLNLAGWFKNPSTVFKQLVLMVFVCLTTYTGVELVRPKVLDSDGKTYKFGPIMDPANLPKK